MGPEALRRGCRGGPGILHRINASSQASSSPLMPRFVAGSGKERRLQCSKCQDGQRDWEYSTDVILNEVVYLGTAGTVHTTNMLTHPHIWEIV